MFFLVIESARSQFDFAWPRSLAAMFYVANWAQPIQAMYPLEHTWSLGVEEQFYAIWPLLLIVGLAWLGGRAVIIAAIGLAAASVATRAVGADVGQLERALDPLMIGCLLGIAATAGRLPQLTLPFAAIGLFVLAIAAVVPLATPAAYESWPAYLRGGGLLVVALASAALIIASMAPGKLANALSWRPLVAIGRVSYGLYLWHFLICGSWYR